jgi:hypothetical protein
MDDRETLTEIVNRQGDLANWESPRWMSSDDGDMMSIVVDGAVVTAYKQSAMKYKVSIGGKDTGATFDRMWQARRFGVFWALYATGTSDD